MPEAAATADAELSPAEARLAMMELANMISVPMALTAGRHPPRRPRHHLGRRRQPAAALVPAGHPDPSVLERLLRLLTSHGVFSESEHVGAAGGTRQYALTAVGRTLVPTAGGACASSYADYVLQHHQDELVHAWPRLRDAVLDPAGPDAFARVHGGVSAYAYYGQQATELMMGAMTGVSRPFMETLLDGYAGGFDGVETLVDVGGSSGLCLQMIMRRVTTIREGVNFDLPSVVAAAPPIAGVRHVGGDMIKSIPCGDAIFMKWMLIIWTDDECTLILKNCYKALPEGGKLIMCDPVLSEATNMGTRTRALLGHGIFVMANYRT